VQSSASGVLGAGRGPNLSPGGRIIGTENEVKRSPCPIVQHRVLILMVYRSGVVGRELWSSDLAGATGISSSTSSTVPAVQAPLIGVTY
jgi:hypothetical protein